MSEYFKKTDLFRFSPGSDIPRDGVDSWNLEGKREARADALMRLLGEQSERKFFVRNLAEVLPGYRGDFPFSDEWTERPSLYIEILFCERGSFPKNLFKLADPFFIIHGKARGLGCAEDNKIRKGDFVIYVEESGQILSFTTYSQNAQESWRDEMPGTDERSIKELFFRSGDSSRTQAHDSSAARQGRVKVTSVNCETGMVDHLDRMNDARSRHGAAEVVDLVIAMLFRKSRVLDTDPQDRGA